MSSRYQKTEAGRAEIRERRLDLPRPARTLLLILDAGKTGDEWVAAVAGTRPEDLDRLVQAGLVEPVSGAPAPRRSREPEAAEPDLATALASVPFRSLYDHLTVQAKSQFGLMKGYKAVLDIERCADVDALRRYALSFVDQVRTTNGDSAARALARELAALR